jgi:hypothetical protein
MEKTLHALRAEFMVKKENSASKIDLEHYSVFFDKSIRIMKHLFGKSAERVELKMLTL